MKELLILTMTGVIALFAEIFDFKKWLFPLVLLGLAATVGVCALDWGGNENLYGMQTVDNYSLAFTGVICVSALLWFVMSRRYFAEKESLTDQYALVLFSLVGCFVLSSFSNLVMLFMGIEILSIPLYVLAGSRKNDLASNEAAFKYFLLGAFASGFLLLGITLIYGATGSFDVTKIAQFVVAHSAQPSALLIAGILLILVGLSFKVSVAPFHFWTPDVYQGAPTLITAFMATIVKTAAFAGFYRLFKMAFSGVASQTEAILCLLVALTILLGNILAVYQSNVKRMLSYSSISHAGFMLMSIFAIQQQMSDKAILYYAATYSTASLAAFLVLYLITENDESEDIGSFNGLLRRSPLATGTMTLALLSMAGIPPLAGFFAKYLMFVNVFKQGYAALVLIAIVGSLIGVYYYFKILRAMFFKEPETPNLLIISTEHKVVMLLTSVILIVLGLMPQLLLGLL